MNEKNYMDDWVEVVDFGEYGWEWDIFRSYYSPSARRYFWDRQCGCSCNCWEDPSEGGWMNGDRRALVNAVRENGGAYDDIKVVHQFKEDA